MNKTEQKHVCPAEFAGGLDNSIRKLLQNPQKILNPFIKEGMTVLDVGCGPGFFSVEIAKMLNGSGKVIAADIQDGMLNRIRQKINGTPLEQRIELHKSDYERIGVTEKVDFVLAFWMVHEVRNQKMFFEELTSILKPNGLILIIEPKIHVAKKAFRTMVDMLKESGFTIVETPKVFFSRAIVLIKTYKIKKMDNKGEIIIYQNRDNNISLNVRLEDENVWLTQQQMAELFQTSRTNVVEHIKHIFEEGELDTNATCRNFRQVQNEGNRMVERELPFYNLDLIISLGYRIKSRIATQFRIWATQRLKEYIIKGFTMDDERLKNIGGGGYWYELLNRIRDIRSSEKVLYRQVLDLYATSIDYDPKSLTSIDFFKIVQNKLHYATHGHTAAEIIFERVDSDKPFMGLTTFTGNQPNKKILPLRKII